MAAAPPFVKARNCSICSCSLSNLRASWLPSGHLTWRTGESAFVVGESSSIATRNNQRVPNRHGVNIYQQGNSGSWYCGCPIDNGMFTTYPWAQLHLRPDSCRPIFIFTSNNLKGLSFQGTSGTSEALAPINWCRISFSQSISEQEDIYFDHSNPFRVPTLNLFGRTWSTARMMGTDPRSI